MDDRPITNLGSVLRTQFEEVHGRQSAIIANEDLGVRTRIELDLSLRNLRIFQDRLKQAKPTFVLRHDLLSFDNWQLDHKASQVTFVAGSTRLTVSATGTVRMANAEVPPQVKEQTQLIEVVGIVGNPELKRVKDGTLARWTAGVGEKQDDITRWTNCLAWRALAEEASKFPRGTKVRVTGLFKTEEFTDRETGQVFPKQILVLHSIQAA